jgi:hypothetical protein
MRRDARNYLEKYRRRKLRAVGGDDAVLLADYFEKKKVIGGLKFLLFLQIYK